MSTTVAVSAEYPKWLRKSGARDKQVYSSEEETASRDEGWSHEVIVSEQRPPLGMSAPPPSADSKPQPGTIPASVLTDELERQRETMTAKFDRAWTNLTAERDSVKVALQNKTAELDKLTQAHKALNDQYNALSKEHANLLRERNEEMRAKKPGPVTPTVSKPAGA